MNLQKAGDYFLLPISVCQMALQKRLVRELQVLLAMKAVSSGRVTLSIKLKNQLAQLTATSVRTIEKSIKELEALKWIGRNGKTIILRAFGFMMEQTGSTIRTCIRLYPYQIRELRPILTGALIGYLVHRTKHKEWLEKHGEITGRRLGSDIEADNSTKPFPNSFRPVALSVIAGILGCPMSTADRYKAEAIAKKYIARMPNFKRLHMPLALAIGEKRYGHNQYAGHIQIVKGKVVIVLPDMIEPLLSYKSRRKHEENGKH